jgi:hypothetical protein
MITILNHLRNLFDRNPQQLCGLLAVTVPEELLPAASTDGSLSSDTFTWITLDNLQSPVPAPNVVIAILRGVEDLLDPLGICLSGTADLRNLVHSPAARHALNQTCHMLAEYYQSTFPADDLSAHRAALSWAVEYRLAREEVTNLVAILPCADLDRFLSQGTALRIYRSHTFNPKIHLWMGPEGLQAASEPPEPELERSYSLAHVPPDTIEGFTPSALFTFPLLEDYFLRFRPACTGDLMQSLYRAGRKDQLTETLFLLARDTHTWNEDSPEWQHFHPDRQQVIDLALRAATLYGLLSPELLTRGDDCDFSLNCYHLLIDILEPDAPTSPEKQINRALAYWFGLPRLPWLMNVVDPEQDSPKESGDAFRAVLDEILRIGAGSLGSAPHPDVDSGPEVIRHLFYAAHILNRSSAGQWALAFPDADDSAELDCSDYLAQVVRARIPLVFPSPLLTCYLQTYVDLSTRWQAYLKRLQKYKGRRTDEVEKIQREYRELFDNLHLPAHEQFLMRQALQRDWAEIEQQRKTLSAGPDVKIYLRSPWATHGVTENLYFDVTNEGDSVALNVILRLDPQNGFDLLPSDDTQPFDYAERKLGDLLPDEIRRASWQFRPHDENEHMRLLMHINVAAAACPDLEWGNIPILKRISGQSQPLIHSYHPGRVVSKADFFGRHAEILRLLSRLRAGNHTLIYGPRRMGKTSALRELKAVLEDPKELNRYDVPQILREDLRGVHPVEISLQTPSADTGNPAQALFQHEILDKVYQALEGHPARLTELQSRFEINPVGACLDALKELFAHHPGERIAMLVDEWDRLYIPGFTDLSTNLRSLILSESRITWFFTSTYAIVLEAQRGGSPLHNILATLKMDAMSEDDAWQLIQGPGLNANMGWQGEAAFLVTDETGRWPYLIQAMGLQIMETYEKDSKDRSTLIDKEKVRKILDNMAFDLDSRKKYFGYLWDLTRSEDDVFFEPMSWMGRMILWALLEHIPKPQTDSDLYTWIIAHLKEHRNEWEHSPAALTDPLPDLPGLQDEFERELSRLKIAFGVIQELPSHSYTFAVPLMVTALKEYILEDKNLIHNAYLGITAPSITNRREPPGDDEFL